MEDHPLPKDSFYRQEKEKRQSYLNQFRPDRNAYKSPVRDSRRIIFFDLLIIVILMGVISPFIMTRFGPVRSVGPYHYSYKVMAGEESLLHLLEIENTSETQSDQPLIEVQFFQDDQPLSIPQVDLAPLPGMSRLFSVEIPLKEGGRKYSCRILLEEEVIILRRSS